MKLVTGIEAIQSRKPWKHQSYDDWVTDSMYIEGLTSEDLRKKEFIIKEEPREFWIDTETMNAFPSECTVNPNYPYWIRVRELIND